MSLETTGQHRVAGGTLRYCRHASSATSTAMRFSLFLPEGKGPFPLLLWLSGLTCTEENFTTKSGAYLAASRLGLAVLAPDTSPRGEGVANAYPVLAGNRAVTMPATANLVQIVLNGGYAPATAGNPRPFGMPPYVLRLSDQEIAAVLTHIRSSWGNQAAEVADLEVVRVRESLGR